MLWIVGFTPPSRSFNLSAMNTTAEIEALILRVGLRDRAAFSMLYAATSAKLFGVALRVLDNRAEAEEVLQEAYIKTWQNADRYAANGLSPMTWLITLTRNAAIDRIRARKVTVDIADQPDMADAGPTPEQAAVTSSDKGQITGCLAELEPDRADAVRAAYMNGDSYEELAARHKVPLNTMRTWLRRSLLKLKECMTR
jgi:RNA polymerase sigma-70 factor, ECF subfamily